MFNFNNLRIILPQDLLQICCQRNLKAAAYYNNANVIFLMDYRNKDEEQYKHKLQMPDNSILLCHNALHFKSNAMH